MFCGKAGVYDKNSTRHKILHILPTHCMGANYLTIRVRKWWLGPTIRATKSNTRMHQEEKLGNGRTY